MTNKRPAIQFYPGDWFRSSDVRKCSMMVQGVWLNCLLVMHDEGEEGKLSGSVTEICRVIGAQKREFRSLIRANLRHNFADIHESNGIITIVNRRMNRDFKQRQAGKGRQARFRQRHSNAENNPPPRNGKVTPYSSTSSSSINNIVTYPLQEVMDIAPLLGMEKEKAAVFWNHYQAQGWKRANGLPITDLRAAMVNWRNDRYGIEKKAAGGEHKQCREHGCTEEGPVQGRDDTGQTYFYCKKHGG